MQSVSKSFKFFTIFAVCSIVAVSFWSAAQKTSQLASTQIPHDRRMIEVNGVTIDALVSDQPSQRIQGLSGRQPFNTNTEAMLFVFDSDGRHGIWMKDMLFDIDILWLTSEGIVIDMELGVTPDTYPVTFRPKGDARYVVEMNAGSIRDNGIVLGNSFTL